MTDIDKPIEKDIDKAAREHVAQYKQYGGSEYEARDMENEFIDGFTAGAQSQSRQSEIDELIEALGDLKAAVESYDEQDEICIKVYEFVLDKATQLLEKYGKKENTEINSLKRP